MTSLQAVGQGAVGISIGNVVGSNIANVLLVLAIAVILSPIVVHPNAIMRDGLFMVGATGLLCALLWFDQFNRVSGFFLVVLLISYLVFSLVMDQRRQDATADMHREEGEVVQAQYGLGFGLMIAVVGLIGVVAGANLLVEGSVTLARSIGISETVIGLTIVAIGTSLPELATSVVAAFRKKADVALGNVIGSNIFNILGILGLTALVHPFSVRSMPSGDVTTDALASGAGHSLISVGDMSALVLSVALMALFAITGKLIARWEGAVLLLGYALYMGLTFNLIPVPAIL